MRYGPWLLKPGRKELTTTRKLVGALQSRYGWSREEAEREIDRRMGRAA